LLIVLIGLIKRFYKFTFGKGNELLLIHNWFFVQK